MAGNRNAKKKKRNSGSNTLHLPRLLLLVALVLIVFEGRIVGIMFSEASSTNGVRVSSASSSDSSGNVPSSSGQTGAAGSSSSVSADSSGGSVTAPLVGVGSGSSSSGVTSSGSASSESSTEAETASSSVIVSDAVVPEQSSPVDDSYFSDAVFIGDSRMEGFRNTSGITQGTFLTSVGMALTSIASETVSTSDGKITVYQGLSGRKYGKIYLMLGTNDLGYYPMDQFQEIAESVLEQMHQLQNNAIIYVISVLYVEPSKVTTSYVNNDNVRTVNGYLLGACEDLDYCHYLNLNEIFDNGYGSMLEGATADGVHLEPAYSRLMLDYLKSHYIAA